MESVENIKNDDMPLSLISKLCDSRLKELSGASYSPDGSGSGGVANCSVNDFQESSHTSNSIRRLYSNVLDTSNAMDVEENNAADECENYSIEIEDAESQQLQIPRNLVVSRHIKSLSTQEYLLGFDEQPQPVQEEAVDDLEFEDDYDYNADTLCYLDKRLESYRSILTHRVQAGRWGALKTYKSLRHIPYDHSSQNTKNYLEGCTTDREIYIAALKHLRVFYGLIEKPNSIKSSRLGKLFNKIGVASLPLQSVTKVQKQLYIQDGTARVEIQTLCEHLKYGQIVSNIPVALIGTVSGVKILVEDVIFATPEDPEWPLARQTNIEMIFVSGLYIGIEDINHTSVDLLQDYILGLAGSSYEQSQILASRARVCFVGNLMSRSLGKKAPPDFAQKMGIFARNMEQLDAFLEPIVRLAEVFLVPGDHDLTLTPALPQPPMHSKLFSESGQYPTLKRLTNPARIQLSTSNAERSEQSQTPNSEYSWMDNSYADLLKEDAELLDVVLQSGSSVKHNMDYCDISCPLEMGIKLLEWGHLHPLCDNLSESSQTIFSLKGSLPHLMVIGNVPEFKVMEYKTTKIIGVPSFRKTNTAVVLTKEFNVIPISFKLY